MTTPGESDPLASWVDVALLSDLPGVADLNLEPEQLELAGQAATDVLFALSGRRWSGVRAATLSITGSPANIATSLSPLTPWGVRACSCHSRDIDPGVGPIVEVLAVTVGDVVVPLDQVQVVDGRRLRIRVGTDPVTDPLVVNRWPTSDGYYVLSPTGAALCGRPRTVTVELTYGQAPPPAGALAALALAVEFAKAIAGSDDCQLPGNAVSVNRQGVSVLLDVSAIYKERRTGIPAADAWLTVVNPDRLQAEPSVWWPEAPIVERLS